MWISYSTYAIDAFNTWNAVGWLLLALMVYGVWRLCRGMRPDAFERGLRALREGRRTTVAFPRQRQRVTTAPRSGWLQISLLPLMLISCAAAMLLAQATRPDEVSRPATWALFLCAGTWYGARAWPHWRGVGPLRNHALAGVLSGVGVSALLWGFYLAVDLSWGQTSFTRVNASVPTLLWWTAVGGTIGAVLGGLRANRIYSGARAQLAMSEPPSTTSEVAVQSTPRRRRAPWGAIAMACLASVLFHASAAPHLYRKVDIRYWTWNWNWRQYRHPGPSMTLTMAPSNAVAVVDTSFSYLVPAPDASGGFEVVQEEVEDDNSSPANTFAAYGDAPAPASPQSAAAPARMIQAGELITRDMLTRVPFPANRADVFVDPYQVVGQFAQQRLAAMQPIGRGQTAANPATTAAASGQDAASPDEIIDNLQDLGLAQLDQQVINFDDGIVTESTGEPGPPLSRLEAIVTAADAANEQSLNRQVLDGAMLRDNMVPVVPNPPPSDPFLAPNPSAPTRPDPFAALNPGGAPVDDATAPNSDDPFAAPSAQQAGAPAAAGTATDSPFAGPLPQPPASGPGPRSPPVQGPAAPRRRPIVLSTLVTKDGRTFTGINTANSADSLALDVPGGTRTVFHHSEIEELRKELVETVSILLTSGSTQTGVVIKSSTQSLQMQLTNGKVVSINMKSIKALSNANRAPSGVRVGPARVPQSPSDIAGEADEGVGAAIPGGSSQAVPVRPQPAVGGGGGLDREDPVPDPFAATVDLKDGRTLKGRIMEFKADSLKVAVTGGKVVSLDQKQVKLLRFDNPPVPPSTGMPAAPLAGEPAGPPPRVPTPIGLPKPPPNTTADEGVGAGIPSDSSEVVPFVPPAGDGGGEQRFDGEADEGDQGGVASDGAETQLESVTTF